MKEKLFSFDD